MPAKKKPAFDIVRDCEKTEGEIDANVVAKCTLTVDGVGTLTAISRMIDPEMPEACESQVKAGDRWVPGFSVDIEDATDIENRISVWYLLDTISDAVKALETACLEEYGNGYETWQFVTEEERKARAAARKKSGGKKRKRFGMLK